MEKGISFLIWISPFVRLGVFFPIGAWIVFFQNRKIRLASFHSIFLQTAAFLLYYTAELLYYFQLDLEETLRDWEPTSELHSILLVYSIGLGFLIANWSYLKYIQRKNAPKISPSLRNDPLQSFAKTMIHWGLSVLLSLVFLYLSEKLFPPQMGAYRLTNSLRELTLSFFFSLFLIHSYKNPKKTFAILRKLYSYFVVGNHFRKRFLRNLYERKIPNKELFQKIYKFSFHRDQILPGWGLIYGGDKWVGFPILFLFLLGLFLFFTAFFSYQSPILGIQYLNSWGLKPGIPDKEFFQKASSIRFLLLFLVFTLFVYVFSKYLLQRYFRNLRISNSPDRKGFVGYLPHSLLAHLVFFVVLFIIPFSLQRKKPSEEKKNQQARHYQPDKLEFYFIDPNIPDEVKDLNGGVITGTETPNQNEGEKIADVKEADAGPKSGYIKRIKGKKVPPTYSNYISAKMRGPESYLDYWRRAPYPYSCVVAYTITGDGIIEDIELIEGSAYPEQDMLTMELIESLSPLMPPPTNGKSIRVTELFWNGSLDPESMPTPLQSEMVTHFDGRYMEELD